MTLQHTIRPISGDRTQFTGPPAKGQRNPFEIKGDAGYRSTLALLEYELEQLGARNVVIELDVAESDIRLDGTLRANAKQAASPAVRIAFDTDDGPMVFATDRYGWTYDDGPPRRFYEDGWRQNVRAIALGLEALRKVDRYGITNRREQYRGFAALPPGTGVAPTGMTTETALAILVREGGQDAGIAAAINTAAALNETLRRARANAHPDRNNGDRSRWNAVDEAEQVLRRSGRLT